MNKVILMGRLTKDPELRYSQTAEPLAIAHYTLAVNKRFKRDGEPDADFINCVAFGKTGEFAEKYYKKGQLVSIVGRLQVRQWEKDGQKQWATEVVVEEQFFAESKKDGIVQQSTTSPKSNIEEFATFDGAIQNDDLPF